MRRWPNTSATTNTPRRAATGATPATANGRRRCSPTACGEVEIEVPRDRDGSFEPQLVKKRQRRLSDVDEIVLSLYAKGLTTGEISAHFADVYGASVTKDTVSRITDRVIEEMQAWWQPAAGEGLRRGVRGCDRGEDPRRPGPQPADLRRDRGRSGRPQGHPRHVGRRRRRGVGEVLAGGAHRAPQPWREGRVLPGLRRLEGPARQCGRGVAADHGADLICSPWGWRDGPAGHPRRLGQDLCKRVAFEVQMQTCPAGAVAGLASASGSSASSSAC